MEYQFKWYKNWRNESQFLKLGYFNFNITIYDIDYSVKFNAINGYLYIQIAEKDINFLQHVMIQLKHQ